MSYSGETGNFGLPYRQDGDISSGAEEAVAWEALDGALQGLVDALGVGVIDGGEGTIDGGDLVISALKAIIPDGTGGVYIEHVEEIYEAGDFAEGDSYIHAQLTATSRADKSSTYYIDTDPDPAADAICLCRVTVTVGVITAVDNTVKAVPAIAERIPWEVLQRSYDDATTLLANLSAWLGTAYVGETPPGDIDARLTALEAGGGGGGGGTVYWAALQQTAAITTTILAAIAAAIAQHVVDVAHGGGGSGGTAVVVTEEVVIANDLRSRMVQVRSHSPDVVATQLNALYIVDGVYGDGSGGTEDRVDRVNSTW